MKYLLKILVVLITITTIGCSSSDDSNDPQQVENTFTYNYEGVNIPITSIQAIKVENTIAVTGLSDQGKAFAIEFNKFGDLSSANSYSVTDFSFPLSISFAYFKSNYFNFELLEVDEINKRVSVSFSGNLYEDEYDINSTTHTVQGSFNVSYTEQTPQVSGLEVFAKLNGVDWYSTTGSQSGGFFSGSDIELNRYSDDEYFIGLSMNHDNTTAQSYDFASNAIVNKVTFKKYDPSTNDFIDYETSGIFNITEKTVGLQITQVVGTFSLTATNGSEVINITQGRFNQLYSSY